MNYMSEVARLLGLELNEKFRLKGEEGIYMITENGLLFEGDGLFNIEDDNVLAGLLEGEYEVSKMPWKPKDGDIFWYYNNYTKSAHTSKWSKYNWNISTWKIGNCFRTEKEAITQGKKIMEMIEREYEEA